MGEEVAELEATMANRMLTEAARLVMRRNMKNPPARVQMDIPSRSRLSRA